MSKPIAIPHLPESTRRDIAQALHLAENLGGEAITVAGEDVAGEILRVARARNVSMIIVGKSQRSLWSRLMRPSVAAAVLEHGASFDILVMSTGDVRKRKSKKPACRNRRKTRGLSRVAVALLCAGEHGGVYATVIAWGVAQIADVSAVAFVYLIAVLMIAADHGFRVSAYASIVSFLVFDFLFVLPIHSLAVSRHEDMLMLYVLLRGRDDHRPDRRSAAAAASK